MCFACHGVYHGPQGELATGKCRDCHTKSFDLRPKTHVSTWKAKPHAEAGRTQGVNRCMMCHDAAKDCDVCHAKQAPEVAKMPRTYETILSNQSKGPSIKIYPKGKTSMSQCVYCHPDLDDITPGRIIFAHAEHLRRNYSCEACHPKFGHNERGTVIPDMLSCYRCHGVTHAKQGPIATEACDKCHPKEFELMPTNHSMKFIKGEHKKRANTEPEYCAMCHTGEFCVGCHRGEKVSPNAPGRPVIPADHRKADWKVKHGGLYLGGRGACGSCHTDESCKRCHKTVMPHPAGWIENHAPAKGVTTQDCNVCHTDRSSCQSCHHQRVQRAELVKSSCAKGPGLDGCHAEMNTNEPTKLKHKSFAEHASHFGVASKTRDKKPYTCDDCHIGFGTNASAQHNGGDSLAEAGHDVRLCYGCHGAVDYQNRRIAPWPGAELCIKCHSDINV